MGKEKVMTAMERDSVLRSAARATGVVILGIAFCAAGGGARAARGPLPESVEAWVIPNYHLLRPDVASGGQPTENGLVWLEALGFRTIIDLRAPAEGTAAEEKAVRSAGLRYVSVPITPETFRREDVEAIARVLGETERGPVLLHCASGNRAGGVWTVLRVMEGRPYDEAEAEGRTLGLQSPAMVAAVRRVAGAVETR
jgi:uncharacterized protein (TIGR01244 family)